MLHSVEPKCSYIQTFLKSVLLSSCCSKSKAYKSGKVPLVYVDFSSVLEFKMHRVACLLIIGRRHVISDRDIVIYIS